jgi:hypothetical protein
MWQGWTLRVFRKKFICYKQGLFLNLNNFFQLTMHKFFPEKPCTCNKTCAGCGLRIWLRDDMKWCFKKPGSIIFYFQMKFNWNKKGIVYIK